MCKNKRMNKPSKKWPKDLQKPKQFREKSRASGTHERIRERWGGDPHLPRPLRLCCSIVPSPAAPFANPYEMEGVLVDYFWKMVTQEGMWLWEVLTELT